MLLCWKFLFIYICIKLFLNCPVDIISFIWYYQGIKQLGPSRASMFINVVPVSAVLMAFFILAEPLEASLLWGTVLVTVGLFLTNRFSNSAQER